MDQAEEIRRLAAENERLRDFLTTVMVAFMSFAADADGCVSSELETEAEAMGVDMTTVRERWLNPFHDHKET